MTAKTRNLLLAFAALGLGASAWSSYVHYALLTRPGYTSACDINSTISCTQAYLSQYGSMFGVPVALGGLLFFTFVLLMVAFGGRSGAQARENVPGYIFVASTIGLAVVLYLAWASFFRLNAVCLLCVATYVAVVAIFIISGAATSFSISALPGRASKDIGVFLKSPVALAIALLFSVGFIGLVSAFPREGAGTVAGRGVAHVHPETQYPPLTDQQKFDLVKWFDVQPIVDVPIDRGNAKVLVVKFNDFMCPACRQTYFDFRTLLKDYEASGQVKYVMKHYPLEPECNPSVPGGNHRASCEASAAYELAKTKGTSDKVEEWMFDNLASLSPQMVRENAPVALGLPEFEAQYAQALVTVRADAELGAKLQVNATPTYFINGRRVPIVPPEAFRLLIDHELKRP